MQGDQLQLVLKNLQLQLNTITKQIEIDRSKEELEKQKIEPNLGISMMLSTIGLALTTPQQLWLSKPDVLLMLPNFLSNSVGKDALQLLVEEFKSFIELNSK